METVQSARKSLIEEIFQSVGYKQEFIDSLPNTLKSLKYFSFAEEYLLKHCHLVEVDIPNVTSTMLIIENIKFQNNYKLIRSELLEWMLLPENAVILFKYKEVRIKNAIIDRFYESDYKDIFDLENRKKSNSYALDLAFKVTDVDLVFIDCVFRGGINLEGAKTKDLVFSRCTVGYTEIIKYQKINKVSFNGNELFVDGCLKINNENEDRKTTDKNTYFKSNITSNTKTVESENLKQKFSEKILGQISLENAKVDGVINFNRLALLENASISAKMLKTSDFYLEFIETNSWIDLSYSQINGVLSLNSSKFLENASINATSINTFDFYLDFIETKSGVDLSHAKIKGILNLNSSKFLGHGDKDKYFSAYQLSVHNISIVNSRSEYYFSFLYADISGFFALTNSKFEGVGEDSYSIDLSRINAKDLYFRDGLIIRNGLSLFGSSFDSLDLTGSFISKNIKNDVAIELSSCIIKEGVSFSPRRVLKGKDDGLGLEHNFAFIFGKIILDNTQAGFINFGRIRLIYDKNKVSVSANNLVVKQKISFLSNIQTKYIFDFLELETNNKSKENQKEFKNRYKELSASQSDLSFEREDEFGYIEYYIYLNIISKLVNFTNHEDKVAKSDELERFVENNKREWDNFIEFIKVNNYLFEDLLKEEVENPNKEEEFKNPNKEILETAILMGEVSISGLKCEGQVDCSSSFFYGINFDPKSFKNETTFDDESNALTIKYSKINGQLFLNEGPADTRPFRVYGRVNLHSTELGQFFVSPKRGIDKRTQWKIIGLKYDYIYSNEKKDDDTKLEKCEWFHDYKQDNDRQPYEQLALTYLKLGYDTKARKILLKIPTKNPIEWVLFSILKFFALIGAPHYIAMLSLVALFLGGWKIGTIAVEKHLIVPTNIQKAYVNDSIKHKDAYIKFDARTYSFQKIAPFVLPGEQKDSFSIKSEGHYSGLINFYFYLQSVLGTILVTMFTIGIARLLRRG